MTAPGRQQWATLSASPDAAPADGEQALAAWLRLALSPGMGEARQRLLLSAFGLPEQVFASGVRALAGVIGHDLATRLLAHDASTAIATHLAWAREPGNHIITLADHEYPRALLTIADPPVLLFARGRIELLQRDALAIVGARSATPQGLANAAAFAKCLSGAGLTVVSGLALGIDAAAHEGALHGDASTVAVIGTGPDRIYPARNEKLARRIAEQGLIISEFPLGTQARRHNFPRRNRLIAGLARGVLVVEAATDSGSLITARLAGEQGREVFAIPGSIHSPLARGCHRLIREGAKLVEAASDILEELQWESRPSTQREPEPADDEQLAPDQRRLLQALGHDPVDSDTLLQRSGLTAESLSAILLTMELEGRVARLPGGKFQRTQ